MKKILVVIGSIILLLLIAAIVLPIIFKDKIMEKVKTEINNNVNAKVDFSGFGLSLFRSFPDFSVSMENLSVIGINEFDGDTLTYIKDLHVTVDLMSVISDSQIEIEGVSLNEPYINLLVLENGKANWDIAKPSADTTSAVEESSSFKASLKKYSIDKGVIRYDDKSLPFRMELAGVSHSGKGDFTEDLFTLSTKTVAETLNLWYGGVKYIHNVKTELLADLDMDMPNMKFTFKENELKLNELALGFNGFIAMPADDIDMDFTYEAKKNDFKNFISLIPGVYKEGFKDLKSSGSLAIKGFVKGIYNDKRIPAFGAEVAIQNGMFQYPSLPTAVNNVQMDLKINNPDGVTDHTAINLSRLHAEIGKEPFDAKMVVKTPVSDADIDAMIKGTVNLANIKDIVPLEEGTSMAGIIKADLTAKGRMSAIEKKQYENFNASGTLALQEFNYQSKDYRQGAELKKFYLTFNPQNITLNELEARMGESDFKATGTLDNLLSYLFKDELLKGSLTLNSNTINLNEFMSESSASSTTPADTSSLSVIEVPANVDFIVNAAIGKLIYEDLVMENVKGNIVVRNKTVSMNNLAFNTLDGTMVMNGTYSTADKKNPAISFDMDIQNFDIQKTSKTFVAIKKMVPIAERCNGKFTSQLDLTGSLDSKMEPVLTSLAGKGRLTTSNATVTNFEPLVKLSDALKMDLFKAINLSNVNISFRFENGRVNVEPFTQNIAGINSVISGSNGFDQSIDYKMNLEIPTKLMGSAAQGVVSRLLSKANAAAGTNLSMGDKINVNVLMGGTVSKPEIKTGLKDAGKSLTQSIGDQVKAGLENKKQELEDKAKSTADSLKKEAEMKAKAEADKLKKEAEAKAKAEADKLKKQTEEEAKKKLKDLFNKPK